MSKSTTRARAFALGLLLVLASGCATGGGSSFSSFMPAPLPTFPGRAAPDSSCQVIIDCKVSFSPGGSLVDVLWNALMPGEDWAMVTESVLLDSTGQAIQAHVKDDLVMFVDLAPGQYRLSSVSAFYHLSEDQVEKCVACSEIQEFELLLPAESNFGLSVAAGESFYFGKLVLDEDDGLFGDKHTSQVTDYKLQRKTKHEVKALKQLIDGFAESAWTERWRARVAELNARS